MPEPQSSQAHSFWNIPNVLCLIRLFGAPCLLVLALADRPWWFAGSYLCLAFTDLIDGPLARRLNQRSEVGAGLDSAADVTLSSSLLIGAVVLQWDMFRPELPWVVTAITSYLIALATSWLKFRKLPSYHTWSAKLTHLLVVIAGLALVTGWSVWPLRIAAMSAILANLENILITLSLPQWRADVPSIFLVTKTDPQE